MNIENYIDEVRAINAADLEAQITAIRAAYEAGKRDCRLGIYDKWYRYNHKDDGYSYDLGWIEQNEITQNDNVTFYEVNIIKFD